MNQKLISLLKIKDEFIPNTQPREYTITLGLQGQSDPHIVVTVNGNEYYNGILTSELQEVTFTVNNQQIRQLLKIKFDNKTSTDTVLDGNGNIIKDKTVALKYVKFDSINIKNYFYKSKYKDINGNRYYSDLFGFNGCWRLAYKNPPIFHLSKFNASLFNSDDKKILHKKYFNELVEIYQQKN